MWRHARQMSFGSVAVALGDASVVGVTVGTGT
ncbi:hypothetical protein HNP40_002321 [Mycobacteroides chelonae]|nr:hypothetical protein [Mycobacteroides chelonae]